MVLADFPNTVALMDKMGDDLVRRVKIGVGATRDRTSYRMRWKKIGSSWVLLGYTKKRRKGRIDSTGKGRESFRFEVKMGKNGPQMILMGEDYMKNVNDGRKAGKGIPVKAMDQYVKDKPIRPRDGNGRILRSTPRNLRTVSFLINRKIKYLGIDPVPFIDEAWEITLKDYKPLYEEALRKDTEILIKT